MKQHRIGHAAGCGLIFAAGVAFAKHVENDYFIAALLFFTGAFLEWIAWETKEGGRPQQRD